MFNWEKKEENMDVSVCKVPVIFDSDIKNCPKKNTIQH